MPKDDTVYLGHMLDMARKAVSLVRGKDREDYDDDETLRLALTYLIQVIGEAARHVSKEFTDGHPQIPWKAILGMRHKVVHDYMNKVMLAEARSVMIFAVTNGSPKDRANSRFVARSNCQARCKVERLLIWL